MSFWLGEGAESGALWEGRPRPDAMVFAPENRGDGAGA